MSLRAFPLKDVGEAHLASLRDNAIRENESIEYKAELPGDSAQQRERFLRGASAFANAQGGDILYGVRADKGVPKELVGIDGPSVDEQKLRLEQMLRTALDPPLSVHELRDVPLPNGRFVLILRIPRSWAGPHRVARDNEPQFYTRTSAGRHPMSMHELRNAFTLREEFAGRFRRYRHERTTTVRDRQTPVQMEEPHLLLQLIPVSAFQPAQALPIARAQESWIDLAPAYWENYGLPRYNVDGLLVVAHAGKHPLAYGYTQLFRSGVIESVVADFWSGEYLLHVELRKALETRIPAFLRVLAKLEVQLPVFVCLTLLHARDKKIPWGNGFRRPGSPPHPIDRDTVVIPEETIESLETDTSPLIERILDSVWNASGWPEALDRRRTSA